jgi:hypothetical protein
MLKDIIKVVDTNGDGKIQYDGPHYPLAFMISYMLESGGGRIVGVPWLDPADVDMTQSSEFLSKLPNANSSRCSSR